MGDSGQQRPMIGHPAVAPLEHRAGAGDVLVDGQPAALAGMAGGQRQGAEHRPRALEDLPVRQDELQRTAGAGALDGGEPPPPAPHPPPYPPPPPPPPPPP